LSRHHARPASPARATLLRGVRRASLLGRVRVAIAVSDDARGRIYEVARACRALGFDHTTTLAGIGVLTGVAEVNALAKLRAIPGVLAVELGRESLLSGAG
jgi:hypothetical protein